MSSPLEPGAQRRYFSLGAFAAGLAFLWIALAALSIFPALPYNAVELPHTSAFQLGMYVPQGWSFFTRDPREERMTMYVRRDGRWIDAVLAPHGRLSNVMGLRRRSRAQGVEAALLMNRTAGAPTTTCSVALNDCLDHLMAGRRIANTSPAPTLCGTVAMVMRPPVPWAWLKSRGTIHMPARIQPLEVEC